jgi:hypothetical protein
MAPIRHFRQVRNCRSAEIAVRHVYLFLAFSAQAGHIATLCAESYPMQNTLFALSFGFAALILVTQQAHAAEQCGPHAKVTEILAQSYGEARQGIGLNGEQRVMEMFVNAKTGTWTITVTLPDGMTCLVATGEHFEAIAEPLPAKGDPA